MSEVKESVEHLAEVDAETHFREKWVKLLDNQAVRSHCGSVYGEIKMLDVITTVLREEQSAMIRDLTTRNERWRKYVQEASHVQEDLKKQLTESKKKIEELKHHVQIYIDRDTYVTEERDKARSEVLNSAAKIITLKNQLKASQEEVATLEEKLKAMAAKLDTPRKKRHGEADSDKKDSVEREELAERLRGFRLPVCDRLPETEDLFPDSVGVTPTASSIGTATSGYQSSQDDSEVDDNRE